MSKVFSPITLLLFICHQWFFIMTFNFDMGEKRKKILQKPPTPIIIKNIDSSEFVE